LRIYLEATRGKAATDELFNNIKYIVIQSLKACQNIMINDKHCYELYGYDLLIDNDLRPWLLEVNASPSLTTTTSADRIMKETVLADAMNIVLHKNYPNVFYKDYKYDIVSASRLGGFELLYDESGPADRRKELTSEVTSTNSSNALPLSVTGTSSSQASARRYRMR
jgi:tubulin polyglutamylase TTLL1